MTPSVLQLARSLPVALLLGLATFAAVDCGDGCPARVPVSGQVLIDGQPLTHGVRFVPENARPSTGELDGQGRFQLTCFDVAVDVTGPTTDLTLELSSRASGV